VLGYKRKDPMLRGKTEKSKIFFAREKKLSVAGQKRGCPISKKNNALFIQVSLEETVIGKNILEKHIL